MLELRGKYNQAKVFTDNIDASAIGLVTALLNQESVSGSIIRFMPDIHAGKGCVIGTTLTYADSIIPYIVGSDIACGVLVVKLKEKRLDYTKLDSLIKKEIGIERKEAHPAIHSIDLDELRCKKGKLKAVNTGFATLGGGNHFIEIDKDEDTEDLYLLIHTGSRHLGTQVANYYQDLAYKELTKEQGLTGIIYELAYAKGKLLDDYLYDLRIVQHYAGLNRRVIANIILRGMKLHEVDSFDTLHNYVDLESHIIRKGAVSAKSGERLIIPLNMRDGALLCVGKGNKDWNESAPHGAGRLLSRADAKESISVSDFKKTMKEAKVFSSCVGKSTIDESPFAYKPSDEIIGAVKDTVDIVSRLISVYNYKAGAVK